MKLLKLIPAAAIVLTAFANFEAKADYPSGWTEKKYCTSADYYLLQRTDTPAAYGVWDDNDNEWSTEDGSTIEYVSFNDARDVYDDKCNEGGGEVAI